MNDRTRKVRFRRPDRSQGGFVFEFPDDLLVPDHPARAIWAVVETLDLHEFSADAKAVEGVAGRERTDPAVLLTLWLYALSIGVGSSREIAELVRSDPAFRWIAGGVPVSHQKLSEFRTGNWGALQGLFTQLLGILLSRGLVDLTVVAQDGTRVRASTSAPSFRRAASLEACREQAELHVKAVLAAAEEGGSTRRHRAAEAKAREYQDRVDQAIATVRELQAKRRPDDQPARASTTDPECRVMKMPDGGFRPAWNVQLSVAGDADGGPRTIVSLQVTTVGSDLSSVAPMVRQIERRTGELPGAVLADANHLAGDCVRELDQHGVLPVIALGVRTKRAHSRHADRSPAMVRLRSRMQSPEGLALFRQRAALVELVNGHLKTNFGMERLLVRGRRAVECAVLLTALSYNVAQHAASLLA